MNIRKSMTGFASFAALAAVTIAPSMAAQTTFASATSTGGNVFTYTSGSGFSVNPGSTFIDSYTLTPVSVSYPATLTFTGLTDVGNVTNLGSGEYGQNLSGGTFKLTSGGGTLLSGKFSEGLLTGTIGGSQGGVKTQFEDVTYDNSSDPYFTQSGLANPGGFSFDLTSVSPTFGLNAGKTKFNSFTAAGAGTFSASAPATVPEPGTVASFIFGGLGVLGLIVRARKGSRSSGLAA